tara:strand:+ start:1533 stop:1853 length:321 start_codon:yes stop_codon:yes gene_type:complete
MEKEYTEEDIKLAFEAGVDYGAFAYYSDNDEAMDWDLYLITIKKPKEVDEAKDIPVTYFQIKHGPEWSKWCDVVGGNVYAISEGYEPDDSELFYITNSQARKLKFI